MALLSMTCPHCHVEQVQFQSVAAKKSPRDTRSFTVFFACNACNGGVAATVQAPNGSSNPHGVEADLRGASGYIVKRIYPNADPLGPPAHTPESVASAFLQSQDNLRRKNWDAAGAMARKSIDIATRSLFADDPEAIIPGVLSPRIDKLEATRRITPDLKDWAHAIRLDGNEAVHGDFTEATARQIVSFAELFLIYVFQLPGMLAERKAKQSTT